MQVMPFHFKRCGVSDWRNAYQNTTCGIGILADALRRTNGHHVKALSIYNSGKIDGYKRYKETKKYVKIIPRTRERLLRQGA